MSYVLLVLSSMYSHYLHYREYMLTTGHAQCMEHVIMAFSLGVLSVIVTYCKYTRKNKLKYYFFNNHKLFNISN